jgi:hypothetical protein
MIILSKAKPEDLLTYHETGSDTEAKISAIKGRQDYIDAKAAAKVMPTVLVRCEKNRVYVETGENDVLLARELGIKEINVIAYSFKDAVIPLKGTQLKVQKDIDNVFKDVEQVDVIIPGVCEQCGHDKGDTTSTITTPVLDTLTRYIAAGIAKF